MRNLELVSLNKTGNVPIT